MCIYISKAAFVLYREDVHCVRWVAPLWAYMGKVPCLDASPPPWTPQRPFSPRAHPKTSLRLPWGRSPSSARRDHQAAQAPFFPSACYHLLLGRLCKVTRQLTLCCFQHTLTKITYICGTLVVLVVEPSRHCSPALYEVAGCTPIHTCIYIYICVFVYLCTYDCID